ERTERKGLVPYRAAIGARHPRQVVVPVTACLLVGGAQSLVFQRLCGSSFKCAFGHPLAKVSDQWAEHDSRRPPRLGSRYNLAHSTTANPRLVRPRPL